MTALDPRSIIQIMGGDLNGPNSVLVPGPGHSKADRSLSIKIDPTDPQGFRAHSFSGDDWRTCRDYISAKLGLNHKPQVYRLQPTTAPSESEFALRLWSESVTARGTIIETYLKTRGLALPDQADDALRFHPCCPYGKGTRYPCLIGLYRDVKTNETKAIHRTALTPDGQKIGRKALGPKAGCAIKLTPDENVTDGLTIAEGLETAIAGMALNFCPTWAVGDAGGVARFPVLAGIECLTILVDNDATGQAAALECSKRWTGAGCEVFRVLPTEAGTDMADIIRGRAA
jgi:putative DNA primase/helicase